ncbi:MULTISPECIES: ABC transporter substrate-binding protein [Kitasatospora]|uniref:ABC transporter substrate-binding protein n=1 Tax=Kitasatospora cystarginea TaxID=58350 RepID=A0ABP5RAZ2_9ACTN
MHRTSPLTASRAGVTLVAGALLLTACSGGSSPKNADSEDLHGKLPAAVKSAGVLKIGSDLNYAPVEFKGQNGDATGLDPDIAEAIGKELGLKIQFVDTGFDKLLPALQAKDIDVAMSALSDTRQRRDGTDDSGKRTGPGVDFVDYFIAGTSILVQKGNPKAIRNLDDLCGHTVTLQRGTTQAAIAERQINSCDKLKKPLTVHQLDTDDEALAELGSGKAVADLNDFPVAAHVSAIDSDKYQVASAQLQPGPYGIALRKSDTVLRDLMAKALDRVIRGGEYDKILAKWNVSAGAAQNAVINGGF